MTDKPQTPDLTITRGEDSIAELCRQEGIAQSQYYSWSKEFLEAGKKRLSGDTAREANTGEVKNLRKEARDLKEVVAEQTLELRLLKKSMYEDGGEGALSAVKPPVG
jgi:transposase